MRAMWRFLRNGKNIVGFFWNRRAVLRIYKNGQIVWEAIKRIAIGLRQGIFTKATGKAWLFQVKPMDATGQRAKAESNAAVETAPAAPAQAITIINGVMDGFLTPLGVGKPNVKDGIKSEDDATGESFSQGGMTYNTCLTINGLLSGWQFLTGCGRYQGNVELKENQTGSQADAKQAAMRTREAFAERGLAEGFRGENTVGEGGGRFAGENTAGKGIGEALSALGSGAFMARTEVSPFFPVSLQAAEQQKSRGYGSISQISTPGAMVEAESSGHCAKVESFFINGAVKMRQKMAAGASGFAEMLPAQPLRPLAEGLKSKCVTSLSVSVSAAAARGTGQFGEGSAAGTGRGAAAVSGSLSGSAVTAFCGGVAEDAWAVQTGGSLEIFRAFHSAQDGKVLYIRGGEDWVTQTAREIKVATAYAAVQKNEKLEVD